MKKLINIIITFILICFTWVFFRAGTAAEGFGIIKKILAFKGPLFMGYPKDHFFYSLLFATLLIAYECKQEFFNERVKIFTHPRPAFRWAFYTIALAIVLLFGVFDGGQFIYFQF